MYISGGYSSADSAEPVETVGQLHELACHMSLLQSGLPIAVPTPAVQVADPPGDNHIISEPCCPCRRIWLGWVLLGPAPPVFPVRCLFCASHPGGSVKTDVLTAVTCPSLLSLLVGR